MGTIKYGFNFELGKRCSTIAGFVADGEDIYVGDANTALECAKLVQKEHAAASGITWYNKECYAEFGRHIIRGDSRSVACLFKGIHSRQYTYVL